jgi:hypothetical protein
MWITAGNRVRKVGVGLTYNEGRAQLHGNFLYFFTEKATSKSKHSLISICQAIII